MPSTVRYIQKLMEEKREHLIEAVLRELGSEVDVLKDLFIRRVTVDYRTTLPLLHRYIDRRELPRDISIIPLAIKQVNDKVMILYLVIV